MTLGPAPLYEILPDAPWLDGSGHDEPQPPVDDRERDRAFCPPTLAEELATLYMFANDVLDGSAVPCTCNATRTCLRCRVATLCGR